MPATAGIPQQVQLLTLGLPSWGRSLGGAGWVELANSFLGEGVGVGVIRDSLEGIAERKGCIP